MPCHMLSELSQFMHNVVETSCLEFVTLLRLVSVGMHRVTDEQKVQLFSQFALDELFKFMTDLILAHSDDNDDFPLFVLRIESFHQFNKLMLIDI